MIAPSLLAALGVLVAAAGHEYRELVLPGAVLRYALVLPDDHDPDRACPALLALPPGRQDESMVEAGLERYWGAQAARRGWIVVSPVAPPGATFDDRADWMIGPLLDHVERTWRVADVHLAGASSGGRSAFRIAGLNADRFRTLLVMPGYPPAREDERRLPLLRHMVVTMLVGGLDADWVPRMQATADALDAAGADVRLEILPGEGHVPPSLDGEAVMERLDRMRTIASLHDLLDDFHRAAAEADLERYFDHLAEDATFIGTDPSERWSKRQFRAYAAPRFESGRAWTYAATSRRVRLAPSGTTAWFDEMLANEKYGPCRGTGVLVREPASGPWTIVQYALTIPVPNDLAAEVVETIRGASGAGAGAGEAPPTPPERRR